MTKRDDRPARLGAHSGRLQAPGRPSLDGRFLRHLHGRRGVQSFILASAVLVVCASGLVAQVPLPPALRDAKTVYFSLEAADMRAMDELAKQWRQALPGMALVDEEVKADVVATVQRGPSGTGYGYYMYGILGQSGTQAWRLMLRQPGGTFAEPLYSDSEVIGDFAEYGGIKNLVRRLRTRLAPK